MASSSPLVPRMLQQQVGRNNREQQQRILDLERTLIHSAPSTSCAPSIYTSQTSHVQQLQLFFTVWASIAKYSASAWTRSWHIKERMADRHWRSKALWRFVKIWSYITHPRQNQLVNHNMWGPAKEQRSKPHAAYNLDESSTGKAKLYRGKNQRSSVVTEHCANRDDSPIQMIDRDPERSMTNAQGCCSCMERGGGGLLDIHDPDNCSIA